LERLARGRRQRTPVTPFSVRVVNEAAHPG
jgi:hypothetical protein